MVATTVLPESHIFFAKSEMKQSDLVHAVQLTKTVLPFSTRSSRAWQRAHQDRMWAAE